MFRVSQPCPHVLYSTVLQHRYICSVSPNRCQIESLRTSRHLNDVETFGIDDPGILRLEPLHAEYYISRELLFSRRQLAVSLANHAAYISSHTLETDQEEVRACASQSGGRPRPMSPPRWPFLATAGV